jgi:hypothetical protein
LTQRKNAASGPFRDQPEAKSAAGEPVQMGAPVGSARIFGDVI